MKNLVIIIAVAFTAFFLSSCSSPALVQDNGQKTSVPFDTTINIKVPVTAARYACIDGHKLPEPKLLGMKNVPLPIHATRTITTYCDGGRVVTGGKDPLTYPTVIPVQKDSSSWSFPDWIKTFLAWLLALAALAAVVAFIIWLWKKLRSEEHSESNGTNNAKTPATPETVSTDSNSLNSDYAGKVLLIRELAKTGGEYNSYYDGGVSIKIPDQSIDVTIIDIAAEVHIYEHEPKKPSKKKDDK